ncbi:MAG: YceI family protein [Stagnimonas sp.]|nr:YceI family protein [Stagnimonas sp.]
MRTSCVLLLCCGLAACQTLSPEPAQRAGPLQLAQLQQSFQSRSANAGQRYRINAAASQVRIYAFRAGAARKAGHNHVLGVPQFEGEILLPSENPADAAFAIRVPLSALVIDDTASRAATGGNFISPRSADDIAGTRQNLLGAKGLDAERFPDLWLHSVAIAGDWPVLVVELATTLHGLTATQPVVLRVEHDAQGLRARGSFALRQSDFGLTPFSVLGGLLAVQDAVAIDFDIRAEAVAAIRP